MIDNRRLKALILSCPFTACMAQALPNLCYTRSISLAPTDPLDVIWLGWLRVGESMRFLSFFRVTALILAVMLTIILRYWSEGMPLHILTLLDLNDTLQPLNPDRYGGPQVAGSAICQISGIVLDEQGRQPISGAVVALLARTVPASGRSAANWAKPWIVVSDLDGRWTVDVADADAYDVGIVVPRYLAQSRAIHKPCRSPEASIEVSLRRGGGTVTGDVWGVQGEPMADSMVSIKRLSPTGSFLPEQGPWVTFTNDMGNFGIQLEPGDYWFEASTPFATVRSRVDSTSGIRNGRLLEPGRAPPAPLASDEARADLDLTGHVTAARRVGIGAGRNSVVLRLAPTGSIRGRVLSQTDGTPIPHAMVRVVSDHRDDAFEEGWSTPATQADAAGNFVVHGVRPGLARITAAVGEFVTLEPTRVGVKNAQWVTDVKVTVERGHATTGRDETPGPSVSNAMAGVVDEDNKVVDVRAASPGSILGHVTSDSDGATSLMVSSDAASSTQEGPVFRDVPIRADGTFSLHGLSPGRYRFTVYRDALLLPWNRPLDENDPEAPLYLDLRKPEVGQELALAVAPCNGVIAGTLSGPDGTPTQEALVEVQSVGTSPVGPSGALANSNTWARLLRGVPDRRVVTTALGKFLFTGLCPGYYELSTSANFGAWRTRVTDVPTNTRLDLRLQPTSGFTAKVLYQGAPALDYTLTLIGPAGKAEAIRARNGKADCSHLEPGKYEVFAETTNGYALATVDLVPGQTVELALDVLPWRAIRGRLVNAGGQPQAGVVVDVSFTQSDLSGDAEPRYFDLREHRATTDAEGRFELPHVLPRTGRIAFADSAGAPLLVRISARTPQGGIEGLHPWVLFDPRNSNALLALGTLEAQRAGTRH